MLIAVTLNAIYHIKMNKSYFIKSGLFQWYTLNLGLVIITVFYGALVAGHKAGLIYNTFPDMGGQWLPSEWNTLTPIWKNFFENHATVQFIHRNLAYLVFLSACFGVYKQKVTPLYGLVVIGQFLLGVFTLLYHVPVVLGTMHQGWSVIVFSMAFWAYKTQENPNFLKFN
jgi:cytochrome c oxidase assembly protein subunit 15